MTFMVASGFLTMFTLSMHQYTGTGLKHSMPLPQATQVVAKEIKKPAVGLYDWFMKHDQGRIAWKWPHYFAIYEELFSRFRDKKGVVVLEIGSRDGGSLLMWRDYFGESSNVHSIDINPEAKRFADSRTKVFTGSQNNVTFLEGVLLDLGAIDIIIDDASHIAGDQMISFEVLSRALKADAVYLIEDIYWDVQKSDTFNKLCGTKKLQMGPWLGGKNVGGLFSCKLYRNIVAFDYKPQEFVTDAGMRDIKKGNESIPCHFRSC